MGINIWFREDVARILARCWRTRKRSTALIEATGLGSERVEAFFRGYDAALSVMAHEFGIEREPAESPIDIAWTEKGPKRIEEVEG